MKLKLLTLIFLLLLVPSVVATSHYTYEHAEEMRTSGRIEWRDYGPGAFDEAIEENKPIFLLLTAPSWCYWCHVYTSDDYIYNPEVYPTINENFIPIYVDADKRQDLTRQYLEGGWPSTTVMTPSRERIFGYSGPRPIENMIVNLQQAVGYVNRGGFSSQISYNYQKTREIIPTEAQLDNLVGSYSSYILQVQDPVHGGFGTGQKFPQGRALDFSLEMYEATGDERFLELVKNTLENQYTEIGEIEDNYNLFDPVEGGFHRYGTRRDWTPPHYEKMLYDNARLLKAYAHLVQLNPENTVAEVVVKKTDSYIINNWYDSNEGGFFGNTDVHGEDEYYGKNPRPLEKPRVEKTKYTDWNSEAIITYLYLWQVTGDEKYRKIAEKSLDFFEREMVSYNGAHHYKKETGEKGVTGSLLDNSYLLLAFVEGYETLGKQSHLEAAEKIADYSLDNLYDWNSGGFFERNSPDTSLYAPGENILLSKPGQENGIMAYAFLKLYKTTNNSVHLNAGVKTLGKELANIGGLDSSYYSIKSAQLMLEDDMLSDFSKLKDQIRVIEKQKQETFWVNDLISENQVSLSGFVVSEQGIDKLEGPIFLLMFVSLIAGFVSFLSPCTLPILPAYLAYTFSSSRKNIKGMTIAFFLGLSLIFVLLGMSATLIGNFLKSNLTLFSQVTGIIIIFFGLYILFGKGFSGLKIKQRKPTTYFGSFLFGGTLGLAWTPCVGPILVAILLLASTTSSVFTGGILLFLYAIGLAVPLIFLSTYISRINKEGRLWKILKGKLLRIKILDKEFLVHTSSLISGILFIILGYLIFSGTLSSFNQYVLGTGFQKWIFEIEERILGLVR